MKKFHCFNKIIALEGSTFWWQIFWKFWEKCKENIFYEILFRKKDFATDVFKTSWNIQKTILWNTCEQFKPNFGVGGNPLFGYP